MKLQSKILVELTNIPDRTFPELKTFFNRRLAGRALFILKRFKSRSHIARFKTSDYDSIRSYSKGKITYVKFQKLKLLAMN